MYIHETRGRPSMEPCVLFPHTRYTDVYMDLYTPRCAVYTHLETILCRIIDHRYPLAIHVALAVPFIKTFKLCFYYLLPIFQKYWGGGRRPFADALTWNWLRMLDNLMILMMIKLVIIVIFSMLDMSSFWIVWFDHRKWNGVFGPHCLPEQYFPAIFDFEKKLKVYLITKHTWWKYVQRGICLLFL